MIASMNQKYWMIIPIKINHLLLKINQKIASFKPYEELLPDYQVALDFTKDVDESSSQANLVKMLKKSKLDYIKSYLDQLDDKAIESDGIDRDKIFSIMKKYYNAATGD